MKYIVAWLATAASAVEILQGPTVPEILRLQYVILWIALSIGGAAIAAGHVYSKTRKFPSAADVFWIILRSNALGIASGWVLTLTNMPDALQGFTVFWIAFGAEALVNGAQKVFDDFGRNPFRYLGMAIRYFKVGRDVVVQEEKERKRRSKRKKDDLDQLFPPDSGDN